MTSEQWQKVKAIVFEAQAREPSSRAAFVTDACAGDEALHREVSSLLESIELARNRYETPALDARGAGPLFQSVIAGGAHDASLVEMIGRRIGPYEIQRELGRGGMGAVYLAGRADSEFRHEVALKIIKRGMDTDAIVRRFRTERQILADFKHPNIARLLDGGTTSDGVPYLVMEYVQGQPITAYCDQRRLGIPDRLAIFRKICAAVAYAHQNLVVHRDIKPSNVLVSSDGEPKLLDFGLAKILGSDSDAHETETVHRWMTPGFASPEQLRGDRVTTVSDVYSMGVLLYELLCGRRPFSQFEIGRRRTDSRRLRGRAGEAQCRRGRRCARWRQRASRHEPGAAAQDAARRSRQHRPEGPGEGSRRAVTRAPANSPRTSDGCWPVSPCRRGPMRGRTSPRSSSVVTRPPLWLRRRWPSRS